MANRVVLVVDDEPMLRELLRMILEAANYVVEVAADGAEALAALERCQPDVALIDWMLPSLDGAALSGLIRRQQRVRRVPIVLMSADDRVTRVAAELGLEGSLLKPFGADMLLGCIKQMVSPRPEPRPAGTPVQPGVIASVAPSAC